MVQRHPALPHSQLLSSTVRPPITSNASSQHAKYATQNTCVHHHILYMCTNLSLFNVPPTLEETRPEDLIETRYRTRPSPVVIHHTNKTRQ